MPKRGTASGIGTYIDFQVAVLKALPRDLDPRIALGWSENGELLAKALLKVLLPNQKPKEEVFPVTVNYDLSIGYVLSLGRFKTDYGDVSKSFEANRTGTADVCIEILRFGRKISVDDAIFAFREMGYRPADLHELLALGEKYTGFWGGISSIIALGSIGVNSVGKIVAPMLEADRRISLFNTEAWLFGYYKFAVVRK